MLGALSPEKRAAVLNALREKTVRGRKPTIPLRGSSNDVVLSASQQGLWTLDQLQGAGSGYHELASFRVEGSLDVEVFEHALREIIQRHEILRTTFPTVEDEAVQRISAMGTLALEITDVSALSRVEQEAALANAVSRERARPFDLATGPLFRVALLRRSLVESVLLIAAHHIILDGWSIGIFRNELLALYDAFAAGTSSPLPALPVQYADYALWQKTDVQRHRHRAQLAYWQQQLAGLPPVLDLRVTNPRPQTPAQRGGRHYFRLTAPLTTALKELARREDATLFMTLLAGFQILLHRYSQQADIAVGVPIANRNQPELEGLIGYFLNTVVMRGTVTPDMTVRSLIQALGKVALAAYEHQEVPFQAVVDALQPERATHYHPLFQVAFNLQNTPKAPDSGFALRITPAEVADLTAKFDLILWLEEAADELRGYWEYSADLFQAATLGRMTEHLRALLESMAAAPEARIGALPLLTALERQQMLVDWNHSWQVWPPAQSSIHALIEAQVEATPGAPAVVYGGESLSYEELNQRANRLARQLAQNGVGAGSLVGVYAECSLQMMVALLAVLKAGGAYLPLDPSYPPMRIAQVLGDARPAVVLADRKLVSRVNSADRRVLAIEDTLEAASVQESTNLPGKSDDELPVYVIYTSGSTGEPKGVVVTHRNLTHSTAARWHVYPDDPSRFLLLSSISFDSSAADIYWTLTRGGLLVLPEQGRVQDLEHLLELIQRHQVSHLLAIPALYGELLALDRESALQSLRTVIVAGDACPPALVKRHARCLPQVQLFNEYGPTEATVWTTVHRCVAADTDTVVPVGRPIPFAEVFVLDGSLQPVPVGVPGEIFIAGAGVARGYLHRDTLTAEKFLDIVLEGVGRRRVYRTGDLARWRDDGTLQILGRTDHQVKIRGYRIELGDVEAALLAHPQVREAVATVHVHDTDDRRLVAFITCAPAGEPDAEELRTLLEGRLPAYAVPTVIRRVEALPRLPNGKIDRSRLRMDAPAASRPATGTAEDQWTPLELAIADIWKSVLKIDSVGRHDDFFKIGGDSLTMIRVYNKVREIVRTNTPIVDLFKHPTPSALAQLLGGGETTFGVI
jgi:amino acid adenylation domain-containing protein